MIKMICWLVLSQFFIGITCSINIGYINSTEYIPTNFTDVSLYNGTCSECICFAFISNNSSNYKTINCYSNNNSCLLFKSSISSSNIRISNNSTIAILSSSINITEVNICRKPTVARYGQCGGMGWTGATKCSDGWSCVYLNAYYSQCLAGTNPSTTPASTSNSTTISFANMTRQNASTGLYWGCCKPSCGWPGKASVSSPVNTCQLDGNTTIDSNTQSICNSGSACMCTNQQPWNISSTLSYGFVGVGLIGETEWDWCCACYSLLFTSDLIAGKEIIVQVVDSLGNNNNMFVLQIPGGGWGYSSSVGCPSQYGGSYSWGNQYGGFTNRTQCDNLPIGLQPGCYWRFDWFMNAQYPDVSWKQVACPSILTAITGCVRN